MPGARSRRTAAATAAAAFALAGLVDADVPAFTTPARAGLSATRPQDARSGLAPHRMVLAPQADDYLTSIEKGEPHTQPYALKNGVRDQRGAEGAARFFTLELITNAKTFLASYKRGAPDQSLLARDFDFTGRPGAIDFFEFCLDPSDPRRILFFALMQVPLTLCLDLRFLLVDAQSVGASSALLTFFTHSGRTAGAALLLDVQCRWTGHRFHDAARRSGNRSAPAETNIESGVSYEACHCNDGRKESNGIPSSILVAAPRVYS